MDAGAQALSEALGSSFAIVRVVMVLLLLAFLGSGIFKAEDPLKRAKAIVAATTYFDKPEVLAEVSAGLGKAMHGIEIPAIPKDELLAARGW